MVEHQLVHKHDCMALSLATFLYKNCYNGGFDTVFKSLALQHDTKQKGSHPLV